MSSMNDRGNYTLHVNQTTQHSLSFDEIGIFLQVTYHHRYHCMLLPIPEPLFWTPEQYQPIVNLPDIFQRQRSKIEKKNHFVIIWHKARICIPDQCERGGQINCSDLRNGWCEKCFVCSFYYRLQRRKEKLCPQNCLPSMSSSLATILVCCCPVTERRPDTAVCSPVTLATVSTSSPLSSLPTSETTFLGSCSSMTESVP